MYCTIKHKEAEVFTAVNMSAVVVCVGCCVVLAWFSHGDEDHASEMLTTQKTTWCHIKATTANI